MTSEACALQDASFPLGPDDAQALVRSALMLPHPEVVARQVTGARIVARQGVRVGADVPFVCAIGAFDGVHAGHRALVAAALSDAARLGVSCAAITFDPDPAETLVGPQAGERLLSVEDRVRGLLSLGLDAVIVFPFTRELAATRYDAFVERTLLGQVKAVSVHVGTNFRFGEGGAGDVGRLAGLGQRFGFAVHAHQLVAGDGEAISATRIRGLVHGGDVGEAARLLGRCHYVRGRVRHGRGQGTGFGFPTANVHMDPRDCLPEQGVYACYFVLGGSFWPAAVNVGAPPSFSAPEAAFLEANIVGFQGNIYGEEACVVFVRWLRDSRRFDSLPELERVVLGNIKWVQDNLGGTRLGV